MVQWIKVILEYIELYRPKKLWKRTTSLWKMSAAMVAWRRKIVNWNCPQWLEILLTFIEVGHVTFYHKLKNCLRLTSQFPNFSAHREIRGLDAFFDFLIMKVNVPIISGSFRVNWKFIIKLKFHAIFVKT